MIKHSRICTRILEYRDYNVLRNLIDKMIDGGWIITSPIHYKFRLTKLGYRYTAVMQREMFYEGEVIGQEGLDTPYKTTFRYLFPDGDEYVRIKWSNDRSDDDSLFIWRKEKEDQVNERNRLTRERFYHTLKYE